MDQYVKVGGGGGGVSHVPHFWPHMTMSNVHWWIRMETKPTQQGKANTKLENVWTFSNTNSHKPQKFGISTSNNMCITKQSITVLGTQNPMDTYYLLQ